MSRTGLTCASAQDMLWHDRGSPMQTGSSFHVKMGFLKFDETLRVFLFYKYYDTDDNIKNYTGVA